jgi:hypothetical protein
MPSQQAPWKRNSQDQRYLTRDCADVWLDFGQQPGAHLRWVRAGVVRRELRTAKGQAIGLLRYGWYFTVSAGGRTFILEPGHQVIAAANRRDRLPQ